MIFTRQFDFLGQRKLAMLLSCVLFMASVGSLFVQQLNYGINFTGGTVVEVFYPEPISLESLRAELDTLEFQGATTQYFGTANDVLIRIPLAQDRDDLQTSARIAEKLSVLDNAAEIRRVEFVGPEVGAELKESGGFAMLFALGCVLIYVALRFQMRFSVGAIAALIHDVLITVGIFSLLQMEFSLSVLAALLAVIGYSLNDTIVVFDRTRENFRKLRNKSPVEVVNISINEVLSRTLITSLTTLLVLFTLLLYGGESVRGFSLALIIGVVIGTYSSVFVASPITLALGVSKTDLMPVEKEGADRKSLP